MATSGVTAWANTARDIITQAIRENGIIPSGDDLTAEEMIDCKFRLNALLKSWGAKAGNLWREASGTVTIPANDASGLVDSAIQHVVSARVVLSATNHRQLTPWGRDDYFSLPNKTASGSPTIYYFSKGVGAPSLYVWPVPPTETTLAIDYLRGPETVVDDNETVDFPEDYTEALLVNLALRCWGIFRPNENPPGLLVARAAQLERELLDASRPDSYFLRSACA